MEEACQALERELRLLGASGQMILSSNVKRRIDGRPYSGLSQPADPGAAIYFGLKGKPISMACDKWSRVEDNIWAIYKHIEALRGQQRWGVGGLEQAFHGYAALPAPGDSEASTWHNTLGVPINATPDQVRAAWRQLVKKHHPDHGGDAELFHRLQRAMERFEAQLKAA